MPDQPHPKRSPPPLPPRNVGDALRYAELHCCTNFTFLEGASHGDELAGRAAELGYAALAITDRNSLAGVVRAHVAAKEAGLKLLIGAEITPLDAPPVLLWATNRAAYGRLSRLITHGRRAAPKGECYLTFDDVAAHADGLIAGVRLAACGLADMDAMPQAAIYREAFGDRCYAVAELHRGPNDKRVLQRMIDVAKAARLPLVVANNVHYHVPERRLLQDVLTAIRLGCSVAQLGVHRFANAERHLKSPAEMLELFSACPDAVARTVEVADRCHFSLDELRYEYPEELCPPGQTPLEHLTRLTWDGARQRYQDGVPNKVRKLIEHELALIAELRYEAYFLTVWDLVRFARSRDILCQGRGSAANSAVCFCLGVTSVDPERIDVLFERFISKERNEAPDIDVDFEHERREEVLQYVYEKYGRERAGITAVVITYQARSAVRDVGKALGLSLDRVDVLAKAMDHHHDEEKLAGRFREVGFPVESDTGRHLVELVHELLSFPRHLSQHVGGMVITQGPLCELVPIENAAMADRTVVQWDKDDLDALGILKVDCLALGMLTAIRKCFDLVAACGTAFADFKPHAAKLTLATVPAEDPVVYDMIGRADTIGVFQIESRAQMSMLPRLKPRCFYDLVIEVAIVRPGPIQGGMVHPYIRRRSGLEQVEYPSDAVRDVLAKTLGVPIFQEQAMRLAVVAAGFTPGEADRLRRAMGAWRRRGVMEQFKIKLIDGMLANSYTPDFAERVFKQIQGFGEYGFPESHAASFALLVYVSAWLKCYYPAAFCAAIINSQPMGFYAPAQLVADAKKHGVMVLPIDVNASEWDCTLELRIADCGLRIAESLARHNHNQEAARGLAHHCQVGARAPVRPLSSRLCGERGQDEGGFSADAGSISLTPTSLPRNGGEGASDEETSKACTSALSPALRLGLRMVRGLRQVHAEAIVAARADAPFRSFEDFAKRSGLGQGALKRLAEADAFGSLPLPRRSALWQALPPRESPSLFDGIDVEHPPEALPPMSPFHEVLADYGSNGLSLKQHPVAFLRANLNQLGVTPARELGATRTNRWLKVGGIVLLRQRPSTAKGITFVTLEDETGMVNLIVRPDVWELYRTVARASTAMIAHGQLQREAGVIHIIVKKLQDLSAAFTDLNTKSRDFR